MQAVVGKIHDTIRGTDVLSNWTQTVNEKIPPDSMHLPALRDLDSAGRTDWEYRSFYIATEGLSEGFLQSGVGEAP